jgi:hypothetical protein
VKNYLPSKTLHGTRNREAAKNMPVKGQQNRIKHFFAISEA